MFWIVLLIIIVIRISNLDKETIVIDEQGNKRIVNKKEKYTAGKVIGDIFLATAICLLIPIVVLFIIPIFFIILVAIFIIISAIVLSVIAAMLIIPIAIVIFSILIIMFIATLASPNCT